MSAVELRGVNKRFDQRLAVDGLSLDVKPGSLFGLLGPNGAGKTTTLRMLVDVYAPDSGSIRVLGRTPGEELRGRLGYLPEERGLYQGMRVDEQLRFFGALRGLAGATLERRIEEWLARLELGDSRGRRVGELSKGTQQKLQFIVAVLHEPELLILDEPFAGLDPLSLEVMKASLAELRRHGTTIVLSTHQMEQVEQLCDELCLMSAGRAVLSGSLLDVKRAHARRVVRFATEVRDGWLDQFPSERVKRFADHAEILLDGDPQELLRRALDAGLRVTRFEVAEASLRDIFIGALKGGHV
jgi:ABC-2 type transport system ATP-binding protein